MNATKGKQVHGKIKTNQRWRKRDNGMIMTVLSKGKGDTWRCCFDSCNPKASHKVKTQVVYKYYDRIR